MEYQQPQPEQSITDAVRRYVRRNADISQARAKYPGMEIGAAYRKLLAARGDAVPDQLPQHTGRERQAILTEINRLRRRPCNRPGCTGTQFLESVCTGCVEGQAGYRSKWTCTACMHRELSKEDLNQWLTRLSSPLKASS